MDAVPVFGGYRIMKLLKIIIEILHFRIHAVLQSAVEIKRWAKNCSVVPDLGIRLLRPVDVEADVREGGEGKAGPVCRRIGETDL